MPLSRVRFTIRQVMVGVVIVAALLAVIAQGIAWQQRRLADLHEGIRDDFLRLAEKTEAENPSDPQKAAHAAKQAASLRKAAEEFDRKGERYRRAADHPFHTDPPEPE